MMLILLSFLFINADNDKISPFEITISKRGERVEMTCTSGCDWKTLTFNISNDQMVSNSGVHDVSFTEHKNKKFMFRVSDFKQGLSFQALNGTAWKKLEYSSSFRRTMYLDERGVGSAKD